MTPLEEPSVPVAADIPADAPAADEDLTEPPLFAAFEVVAQEPA